MVWLNGSITHDPLVKYYDCKICNIRVTKQSDDSYEIFKGKCNMFLHKMKEQGNSSEKPNRLPQKHP